MRSEPAFTWVKALLVISLLPLGVLIGWLLMNFNMGIVCYREMRKYLKM